MSVLPSIETLRETFKSAQEFANPPVIYAVLPALVRTVIVSIDIRRFGERHMP